MEVCVDIDHELLCEFDGAARAQNITRNTAARAAIAAWLSQARRDAALSELFDTASSGADQGYSGESSTQGIKTPKHEIDLVKARIKRLKEVLR